jgi:hypothetical protein
MKKILVSIGAVALGAATVHAESAAGMSMNDNSRVWSVAASLRGFYDDNYTTSTKGSERETFGMSISPSISVKVPMDQTTLGFRYIYGATWYADRSSLNSTNSPWDQSHEFEALFSHSFSERNTLDISDSFVVAQEPELLNDLGNNYRTAGNNIRNHGEITFNGGLTRKLSYVLGYQNYYYDYENSGGNFFQPSLSGLLDRIEHEALFNLRYQASLKTVLVGGYNYRQVDYTSDESIALVGLTPVDSTIRNSRSHIIYAGIDQNFTKEITATLRVGAQFTDYYNDPNSSKSTTPWVSGSLAYTYAPGSNFRLGVSHMLNQTDVVAPDPVTGSVTTDQESTVIFGNLTHQFLSGSLRGQIQISQFQNGLYDGSSDTFYDVGADLTYRFNNHFSGQLGYNYSTLTSDIATRDYDRNHVYIGVTAAY